MSDVFDDVSKLKTNQNYQSSSGTKKILNNVPIRKPHKQTFVRTNADPDYSGDFGLIESLDDKSTYLVLPEVAEQLPEIVDQKRLMTTVDRQGNYFLWPVKLPDPNGRNDNWSRSAVDAADQAKTEWTQVRANMSAGCYEISTPQVKIPEPTWPDKSFSDLLRIAFGDRVIEDINHPVIQRILGKQ